MKRNPQKRNSRKAEVALSQALAKELAVVCSNNGGSLACRFMARALESPSHGPLEWTVQWTPKAPPQKPLRNGTWCCGCTPRPYWAPAHERACYTSTENPQLDLRLIPACSQWVGKAPGIRLERDWMDTVSLACDLRKQSVELCDWCTRADTDTSRRDTWSKK